MISGSPVQIMVMFSAYSGHIICLPDSVLCIYAFLWFAGQVAEETKPLVLRSWGRNDYPKWPHTNHHLGHDGGSRGFCPTRPPDWRCIYQQSKEEVWHWQHICEYMLFNVFIMCIQGRTYW